jgi:hypothetical protein
MLATSVDDTRQWLDLTAAARATDRERRDHQADVARTRAMLESRAKELAAELPPARHQHAEVSSTSGTRTLRLRAKAGAAANAAVTTATGPPVRADAGWQDDYEAWAATEGLYVHDTGTIPPPSPLPFPPPPPATAARAAAPAQPKQPPSLFDFTPVVRTTPATSVAAAAAAALPTCAACARRHRPGAASCSAAAWSFKNGARHRRAQESAAAKRTVALAQSRKASDPGERCSHPVERLTADSCGDAVRPHCCSGLGGSLAPV